MNSFILLIKAMKNSSKENFLIDGFPRNKDNVDGWKKAMDGKVHIQCVLFFDCDENVRFYVYTFCLFLFD
jgi:UMP-CMP kinase